MKIILRTVAVGVLLLASQIAYSEDLLAMLKKHYSAHSDDIEIRKASAKRLTLLRRLEEKRVQLVELNKKFSKNVAERRNEALNKLAQANKKLSDGLCLGTDKKTWDKAISCTADAFKESLIALHHLWTGPSDSVREKALEEYESLWRELWNTSSSLHAYIEHRNSVNEAMAEWKAKLEKDKTSEAQENFSAPSH